MKHFNLFVYGTLMSGFRANFMIPKESEKTEGCITGNLYHYCFAGYPIVSTPTSCSIAKGSQNYEEDILRQDNLNSSEDLKDELDFALGYGRVYGEIYRIPYSEETLSYLDRYEGFCGQKQSLYCRSLVKALTKYGVEWVWVYHMEKLPEGCVRILTGNWRDCFKLGILRKEITELIEDLDEDANLGEDEDLEEDDLEDGDTIKDYTDAMRHEDDPSKDDWRN